MSGRLRAVFAFHEVDKQTCTKAALLVRDDCRGGSCRSIEIQLIGRQSKTPKKVHPHDLLDRALSILNHIPDGQEEKIAKYAYGQFRGRPGGVVHRFLNDVPEEAWVEIAPIASQLI